MNKEELKQALTGFAKYCYGLSPHNFNDGEADTFQYALEDFIEIRLKPIIDSESRLAEQRLIEKVREEFVQLAIQGKDEPDAQKGLALYTQTLKFLDQLAREEGKHE